LLASLRAREVNTNVPRFLLSVGARTRNEVLDSPVFSGFVRGWICEEVQKLEVHTLLFCCSSVVILSFVHLACIKSFTFELLCLYRRQQL
jgi:hypothetical protein